MIPLRDVIPSRTTPYITVTIIMLNALAWLAEISIDASGELPLFLQLYGVVPAAFAPATLITSMFLHGGWMHLIGNMWFLWIFGDNVEDRLGHGRSWRFTCCAASWRRSAQIAPQSDSRIPMLGASGAIAGVMGAYFVIYPRSRVLTLVALIFFWEIIELPAITLLGFWFVMQLYSAGAIAGTGGGVAFAAHVAGFASGAVGGFVYRKRPIRTWDVPF